MVSRVAQLSAIHTEIYHCTKCPLYEGRTRTVPGAGNPDAEILFIGEAPGYNEDQQGLPFVGKSGTLLEELLATINLTRDDVFIANVVKCRPPDNRNPLQEELDACNPYITAQIEVLDPLMIVTLGKFGMTLFFPNERSITKIHGHERVGTRRVYYPLYHPAYALRQDSAKAELFEDFTRIPDILAEVRRKRELGELSITPEPEIEITVEKETEGDSTSPPPEIDNDSPKQIGLFD